MGELRQGLVYSGVVWKGVCRVMSYMIGTRALEVTGTRGGGGEGNWKVTGTGEGEGGLEVAGTQAWKLSKRTW